jgi:predicted RecB family nuclease
MSNLSSNPTASPQWISAKDLYNYTKCMHRVYLDANGNLAEKGDVNLFAKLLWEMGLQTEREYLHSLGEISVTDLTEFKPQKAWAKTLEAMQQGDELIYQGCLVNEHYRGRPDLLVKKEDAPSKWGHYYYEPIDIKAGKGWEEREGNPVKFKKHYAYQMMFYLDQLQVIQSYIPKVARIINVDKEIEEFDPVSFENDYRQAKAEVEKLVSGEESAEPILGSHCLQCEWYKHCEAWVKKTSDPSNIFFIGSVKFSLKQVGLKTVSDLANMEIKKYLKAPFKVPRMGERSLERAKERANVVLNGKPKIRPGYSFPDVETEIYFDIEDDPTRSLTYLYGLLEVKKGREPNFHYFLALLPEDEEQTIRKFWDYLRITDNAVYYVYSHKERTTLKKLMEKYSLDPDIFQKYCDSEYDLYQSLVVKYSDWPTFSYGIKSIAEQIGFSWRDPDPSGINSIVWYNEYLSNPSRQEILNRILQYNEDDCKAMVAVKQYFLDKMNT